MQDNYIKYKLYKKLYKRAKNENIMLGGTNPEEAVVVGGTNLQ